jgi:hypothetical protein
MLPWYVGWLPFLIVDEYFAGGTWLEWVSVGE